MLLEAQDSRVKQKWLNALQRDFAETVGFSSNRAELLVEGFLLKVQPFGTVSKTRWFRLSTKKFSYYASEAGEEMG